MKRLQLIIWFLTIATSIAAQGYTVKGKIINEIGEAVEYATVGIPGTIHGTLSGIDGVFEFTLPHECCDTLVVTHISYNKATIAPDIYKNSSDTLFITMQSHELEELVVYCGKRKKAKLSNRGIRFAGTVTSLGIDRIGYEIGSIIEVKHPFEVNEIVFNTISNKIENARLSVNIYSIDDSGTIFTNIMHHPVYIEIPVGDRKREHKVLPDKSIYIEPGNYYVAVKFVDGKSNDPQKEHLLFPLYLKSGYIRNSAVEYPEKIPVNLGIMINGYEYR